MKKSTFFIKSAMVLLGVFLFFMMFGSLDSLGFASSMRVNSSNDFSFLDNGFSVLFSILIILFSVAVIMPVVSALSGLSQLEKARKEKEETGYVSTASKIKTVVTLVFFGFTLLQLLKFAMPFLSTL